MTPEEAVAKLTAFTNETGLVVGACGCCESPWLLHGPGEDVLAELLSWNANTKTYEFATYTYDRERREQ